MRIGVRVERLPLPVGVAWKRRGCGGAKRLLRARLFCSVRRGHAGAGVKTGFPPARE
jgi:hypothetical protein